MALSFIPMFRFLALLVGFNPTPSLCPSSALLISVYCYCKLLGMMGSASYLVPLGAISK